MGVEITVLSSQATEQAYRELQPQFEKSSGHTVKTTIAGTVDLKKRVAAGETFDLLMMASTDIDAFVASGIVVAGSQVNIARSGVGVAVRAGAPKPDISSPEAFKKTLLAAKSIGYSTGPSGDYIATLFERLGLAVQLALKLKRTPSGIYVGSILVSGDVELGFQQVSELLTYPGIDYVGPLPGELQKVTIFAGGIAVQAKQPEAAKAWIKFLTSPAGAEAFKRRGMQAG